MSNKRQEIVGLLLIALGVLILLSLLSYNPDEEPTISKNVVIHNWMGIVGVIISHYLIKFTLGAAVFVLPVLIGLWGWWIFAKRDLKIIFRFTVYIVILSFLVSISLALPAIKRGVSSSVGFRYSGNFGGVLANAMNSFLGFTGTIIIIALLVLIAIRGYFSWSFYGPLERLKFRKKVAEKKPEFSIEKPVVPKIALLKRALKKPPVSKQELMLPLEGVDRPIEPPVPLPARKRKEYGAEEEEGPEFTIDKQIVETELADGDEAVSEVKRREYRLPGIDLLDMPSEKEEQVSREEMVENARILEEALETFGVHGKVVHVSPGPVITRYEIEPASGVRVSRIASLSDDLARVLQAKRIRVVAPIPGKSVVGVEIPNRRPSLVYFRSIVNSEKFLKSTSKLTIALAKTTAGEVYTLDLAKMPHLLIAGATGSGKSVCINTIIASILFRAKPNEVKFLLIDPKKLELSYYRDLKGYHLITCEDLDEYVITSAANAIVALRSIEMEMERRYEILADATVRNIDEYNYRASKSEGKMEFLPYIVMIIDELADLMMSSAKEVEEPITRLAQMSRAVGIHLVIATQRPSVDVITGVIKANFPARIAFQVASKVDSRTILDANGAEKLLGRGDLLITTSINPEPQRLHNAYVSLDELQRVLDHIKKQSKPGEIELPSVQERDDKRLAGLIEGERDSLFYEAMRLVITHQQGSISLLQRRLRVGYSRAARLIDELEQAGIVGPFTGSKAREVLVDEDYLSGLGNENNFSAGKNDNG